MIFVQGSVFGFRILGSGFIQYGCTSSSLGSDSFTGSTGEGKKLRVEGLRNPCFGSWELGVECWVLVVGCWVLGVGCWVWGVECGVWGVGCTVKGVGCGM